MFSRGFDYNFTPPLTSDELRLSVLTNAIGYGIKTILFKEEPTTVGAESIGLSKGTPFVHISEDMLKDVRGIAQLAFEHLEAHAGGTP